tara:strand:- start:470 stop:607 length:138 start_codon:yes stop_codon:yes gene_type:complete
MSIRRKSTKYARRRTARLIGQHNRKFEKKSGLAKFIDELSSLFKK